MLIFDTHCFIMYFFNICTYATPERLTQRHLSQFIGHFNGHANPVFSGKAVDYKPANITGWITEQHNSSQF